jgi:hypothetical protein
MVSGIWPSGPMVSEDSTKTSVRDRSTRGQCGAPIDGVASWPLLLSIWGRSFATTAIATLTSVAIRTDFVPTSATGRRRGGGIRGRERRIDRDRARFGRQRVAVGGALFSGVHGAAGKSSEPVGRQPVDAIWSLKTGLLCRRLAQALRRQTRMSALPAPRSWPRGVMVPFRGATSQRELTSRAWLIGDPLIWAGGCRFRTIYAAEKRRSMAFPT